jgi:hypothetical protein
MKSTNYKDIPFSQALAESLEDLDDRVNKDNKAALIIIDGGVGEGKTTLAVEVMDFINARHGLEPVNLTYDGVRQLAMGGEDFSKKLLICQAAGLPIEAYDEAGDFNKRGSLTRFNALINRTFETYRAFKIIVILCLPSFSVLDQEIFDKNIPRLLIRVHSRTNNQGNGKAFSLYRMLYIRERMKKLVVKTQAYGKVDPNFHIHFKNLEPARCAALDSLSTKGKLKELKGAEIKYEGLLNYSELARKVGRSEKWVKNSFIELKVKSVKTFQKRKYFNPETVDQLLDFLDDKGK